MLTIEFFFYLKEKTYCESKIKELIMRTVFKQSMHVYVYIYGQPRRLVFRSSTVVRKKEKENDRVMSNPALQFLKFSVDSWKRIIR